MCGIAGVYGLEGIENPKQTSDLLIEAIGHRGPDAHGAYLDSEVILTHTRLSIIDLDARSHQPFIDPEGRYVLVFNGEIYNYLEIRKELPDYQFKTNSDTEVLLVAWKKWGSECLKKLNGMFAFSVWDKQNAELFLCRDRLGIKPLYLYQDDKRILFSSEIRSLLNTGLVPRKLNGSDLEEYLKYQTVHAPRTMIQGVELISPGSFLRISDNEIERKQFWNLTKVPLAAGSNKDQVHKSIASLLNTSVEMRLLSDVPLGAFLSGGIDSSLIVGIVSERLNKKIDTFSVTFDEQEFSEAKYSNLIAKKFGTNHHEIALSQDDFKEAVPKALLAMDHPSGDGPNSYVVSEAVKKSGLTVALSGLGGDELFAGYPFFKQYMELNQKRYLLSFPKYARNLVTQIIKLKYPGIKGQKIAETFTLPYFDVPHTYPINRRALSDKDIKDVLSNYGGADSLFQDLKSILNWQATGNLPELSKVSIAEISTYMQNVLLRDTDQMSMAHALEVRVPFLDHRLVDYVMGIGDNIKYPRFAKSLLIDAYKGLLPDEIIHRPKMGFVFPWEHWMKNELKDLCISSLDYLENETGYFNQGSLYNLFNRFLAGDKTVSWSRIWPIVALGTWMKNNKVE